MPPIQTAENGRDTAGRFAKGNSGGPGRPRRPDLFTVVADRAAAEGVDLDVELWQVCQSLIAQAKGGNVQAARLLFSHMCGDPVSKSDVSLTVETGVPMSDVERAQHIRAIFASAAARLESEGKVKEAARMRAAAGDAEPLD
ncbi:MAG: hypothetical protein IPK26_22360 [Planctomycetes bacterium]|nr:hypothetical protein [Planctomycetota bacterium]